MTNNKARFVASEEDSSISLLNRLSESTCGEVHLSALASLLARAKEVLEHGSTTSWSVTRSRIRQEQRNILERCRAETVESISLPSMDNGQFSRQG